MSVLPSLAPEQTALTLKEHLLRVEGMLQKAERYIGYYKERSMTHQLLAQKARDLVSNAGCENWKKSGFLPLQHSCYLSVKMSSQRCALFAPQRSDLITSRSEDKWK